MSAVHTSLSGWLPKGILVATIYEHECGSGSQRMRVEATTNGKYLLTANLQKNGKMKLWNCQDLKTYFTNGANRSWMLPSGSSIECFHLLKNQKSVAVGSDKGAVRIYQLELLQNGIAPEQLHIQSPIRLPRSYWVQALPSSQKVMTSSRVDRSSFFQRQRLLEGEVLLASTESNSVVCMESFENESENLLVVCLQNGKIFGWDIRSPSFAFDYEIPPSYGAPSALCVDPETRWICIGTLAGILIVYDLRLLLPIHVWALHTPAPILQLVASLRQWPKSHREALLASAAPLSSPPTRGKSVYSRPTMGVPSMIAPTLPQSYGLQDLSTFSGGAPLSTATPSLEAQRLSASAASHGSAVSNGRCTVYAAIGGDLGEISWIDISSGQCLALFRTVTPSLSPPSAYMPVHAAAFSSKPSISPLIGHSPRESACTSSSSDSVPISGTREVSTVSGSLQREGSTSRVPSNPPMPGIGLQAPASQDAYLIDLTKPSITRESNNSFAWANVASRGLQGGTAMLPTRPWDLWAILPSPSTYTIVAMDSALRRSLHSQNCVRALWAPPLREMAPLEYLLAASSDASVRYWALEPSRLSQDSYVILGPEHCRMYFPNYTVSTHSPNAEVIFQEQYMQNTSFSKSFTDKYTGSSSGFGNYSGGCPVPPTPNHRDAIIDLTVISARNKFLVTAGRDGLVKIWK
ncbi:hypothetical protein IE077_001428 [Cardiosporidium cionae]|uniref:Uncharacterized protein n=1 Tax=Cardiosporidium cionae TaxID=476202 RepID=A0ABQ7J691_9APIC|nr:hypothetical protein IE077_001428 [Cardiosporidium cionae]|eukprot:KAF8819205.1 hypothetical protein IE077_001428 [Cardiosporidium cionae]